MKRAIKSINPAQHVANGFLGVMNEEGFDTFQEMKDCYWWDSSDIKDEVGAYLKEIGWFLSDDGVDIYNSRSGEQTSYKSLMSQVYRLVKKGMEEQIP